MKFIKKHMNSIIAIGIAILVFIAFMILKAVFMPNESKAIYGTRLEGKDKVEISEGTKSKVKSALNQGTTNVNVRVAGRLIYIDVKGDGALTVEAAKELGNQALTVFTDAEKAYYDIQILIENDANTTQFPIIGYKHHAKTAISWTKDR